MGITSQETALSVISVIPDVQAEMEKSKKEEASTAILTRISNLVKREQIQ